MKKQVKSVGELFAENTVSVTFDALSAEDFVRPSRYYFIDAFGNRVFVKKQSREDCQKLIDNYFGYQKYVIRMYGSPSANNKALTCKATQSRKGFAYRHKK